ncbi:ATP-binding cassette domain-containing protein [uncultured Sphingomonas sp.]|uniref:ATP-binding cassette domain-containing protein n=1 Tax=uncultured Sphingomonas sp. TaxID=158754 RepID=UPI0025E0CEAC|nr:ATP-binding cassette domain-containing protein [uncultured Sphingomonas sp.]
MPAPPRLAFKGVTKAYGATRAVDDVTLTVEGGQFVALVGQSGSGKSTLLKTINRLIVPDGGRVTIDGADVAGGPAPLLRRRIGYVFQNVGLFPHLTVAENIAMPERIGGAAVDVAARLDQVELPRELADRAPAQLSGGQRQRVGIARALAGEAKLLLMDEPFGALDPVTRDALGRRVRGLHDELGLTSILVTHDMAEALLLADRVLVMDAGRIVADAAPAELLDGKGGPVADALVAVPREQARALAAIEGGQ